MTRVRALRDGLVLAGLLFAAYLFAVVAPQAGTVGFDALSYWIYSIDDPYAMTHGTMGSFVYSPVAARLFQLHSLLPWWQFLWLHLAALLATALWLGGRRWWLAVLAFPPVALELYHGNIHLLIAAAIALGFRYPAAWAFVLVTKVTPGVGLLWFAVRREWRNLAIAVTATVAIAGVSALAAPHLWNEWWELLRRSVMDRQVVEGAYLAIPVWLRLPFAVAIIAWGARTDRHWTVPVGILLAMPILWLNVFSLLVAAVPLREEAGLTPARAWLLRERLLPAALKPRRATAPHAG